MKRLLAFFILSSVKIFSHLFYRGRFLWLTDKPQRPWDSVRLVVFLNHTSLFEPLFSQAAPFSFLWRLAGFASVPGADITLNRPIVGGFWKLMMPKIFSVTRKKDSSWETYLDSIQDDSIILIAPEGRMKRPNGLDKNGKPMSVRGGVADIIERLPHGEMIVCFSGGLHHVQEPGQHIPKLFKEIRMNFAFHDIAEFKKRFSANQRERKIQIVQNFQERLGTDCPR
jgi:hypothetical protein